MAMLAFFVVTGLPIYTHTEYVGALEQYQQLAARFTPAGSSAPGDIVLVRGGSRDLPELVTTPLRFSFGIDALAVRSPSPGSYADALARQVRRWQEQGRAVYVAYSASGGDFTLPGFSLVPAGNANLRFLELQQLTDQKPRNTYTVTLPLAIYRLAPAAPGMLATTPLVNDSISAGDFAAQVRGFYPPEPVPGADVPYTWTSGDALLRLPWSSQQPPHTLVLQLGTGRRPPHLGPAQVCLSLYAEQSAEQSAVLDGSQDWTSLGCHPLDALFSTITVPVDAARVGLPATGSVLLRLESAPWVPAQHDPRQLDRRPLGIQLASLTLK
jgi:hypothetical protein